MVDLQSFTKALGRHSHIAEWMFTLIKANEYTLLENHLRLMFFTTSVQRKLRYLNCLLP